MAESCAECGFDWDTSILDGLRTIDQLPDASRATAARLGEQVYARPEPAVWSANEYIWHLADTFRFSAEWLHDMRIHDHPTHYAIDNDALAPIRGYARLPVDVGLWSLEQSCRLFIDEAATIDPARTCYYHDWQDVPAAQVIAFLVHEAAHHLHDLERVGAEEVAYAD